MSLTFTISAKQFAEAVQEQERLSQWELAEAILCECHPQVLSKVLHWLGENGCCYISLPGANEARSEAMAIADYINACYSRHDKGTPMGDAIRAAIRAAISENDKKDNP
jgi:hypothetical protein